MASVCGSSLAMGFWSTARVSNHLPLSRGVQVGVESASYYLQACLRKAIGLGPIGPAIEALSLYRHTDILFITFWMNSSLIVIVCWTTADLTSGMCRSGPCFFIIFVELHNFFVFNWNSLWRFGESCGWWWWQLHIKVDKPQQPDFSTSGLEWIGLL